MSLKKLASEYLLYPVPDNLRRNFRPLDAGRLATLEQSIRSNYHQGWRHESRFSPEAFRQDLHAHLLGRLEIDRKRYIPWLSKTIPLKNARVVEIGCGTGSSTVALAEQGATVTGIDIDLGALRVAEDRCRLYGVQASIIEGNAADLIPEIRKADPDLIIFYACMEHMLHDERLDSLRQCHRLLRDGCHISIVETPNRLWYFDDHTSRTNFFNWLPDRLAYDYAKRIKRDNFSELYSQYSDELLTHFLRRGRGVSFHEIELALDEPAENHHVVSHMPILLKPFGTDRKFHDLLRKLNPKINRGYLLPALNIILRK